ncbi:tyrosine-type recombinase/integrase [Methylobacterium goesingense]|uniref:Integrase n=2 Tax=Methylobacterium goesingense TaxID=243690 RepID=A0ABV2L2X8_9HYPH
MRTPLSTGVRELLFPLPGFGAEHAERAGAVLASARRKKQGTRQIGDRLPIIHEALKTQWRRLREASGVTNFRHHDYRHTAAKRILRAGGNLRTVQAPFRHEDITTTPYGPRWKPPSPGKTDPSRQLPQKIPKSAPQRPEGRPRVRRDDNFERHLQGRA